MRPVPYAQEDLVADAYSTHNSSHPCPSQTPHPALPSPLPLENHKSVLSVASLFLSLKRPDFAAQLEDYLLTAAPCLLQHFLSSKAQLSVHRKAYAGRRDAQTY